MLVIPLERLAFIIAKAREFDAEVPIEPDAATGSDPPDDDERQVLLDTPDNPTEQELRDAIGGLGILERQELLALMWLGRGDYDADGWSETLREAAEATIANVTDYLVGTPLLGDYLEEGADAPRFRARLASCALCRHVGIAARGSATPGACAGDLSFRVQRRVAIVWRPPSAGAGRDRIPRRLGGGKEAVSQAR